MVSLLTFLLGTTIGSFLNVVIDRVPKGQSIVYPPSHCPHCRHKLAWYDLIPVLSFILLKGKCRYCQRPISYYYPLLEIITGISFVFVVSASMQFGYVYTLYMLFMMCIFIIIFFTDYKYGIIPFYTVVVGYMTVFAYLAYAVSFDKIIIHILSSLGAFLFFFFLFAITKGRGMGFGDVMLVLLLGLFLGFPHIALALYIAFLSGAIISLALITTGSKTLRHDTIPFGPFLIFGALTAAFYGNKIINAVMSFLLA